MKEASGELNMTVVVVIAVASLAAFFYTVLWPLIKENYDSNSACARAICACPNGDPECKTTNGKASCIVKDKKGKETKLTCPWKG